jgi:hypothetical protein
MADKGSVLIKSKCLPFIFNSLQVCCYSPFHLLIVEEQAPDCFAMSFLLIPAYIEALILSSALN